MKTTEESQGIRICYDGNTSIHLEAYYYLLYGAVQKLYRASTGHNKCCFKDHFGKDVSIGITTLGL